MTEPEQQEIDRWFDAVQKDQPTGTIAALVYVRDGQVYLGRGDVSLECKEFPAANATGESNSPLTQPGRAGTEISTCPRSAPAAV